MLEYIQITVQGKVQGVSFRYDTEKKALKLDLKGSVKNLPNGDVESLVFGDKIKINQLIVWCKSGSPISRVNKVITKQLDFEQIFNTFKIMY